MYFPWGLCRLLLLTAMLFSALLLPNPSSSLKLNSKATSSGRLSQLPEAKLASILVLSLSIITLIWKPITPLHCLIRKDRDYAWFIFGVPVFITAPSTCLIGPQNMFADGLTHTHRLCSFLKYCTLSSSLFYHLQNGLIQWDFFKLYKYFKNIHWGILNLFKGKVF